MTVPYDVYTRIPPARLRSQEMNGAIIGPLVIAVVFGDGPDWTAYRSSENAGADWIAAHGRKLPKAAAEALFPEIVNSGRYYRE